MSHRLGENSCKTHERRNNSLSTNGAQTTGYLYVKEWSWIPILHHMQNKFRMLEPSYKTFRRKCWHKSSCPWIIQFLRYNTEGTSNKRKANKMDIIKINNFCTSKDTVKGMKRQPTMGENVDILYTW